MSIKVISIFVAILVFIIFMFIYSLFQVQKVDLLGRVDEEMLDAIFHENKLYAPSKSSFGRFYKRYMENLIGSKIEKLASLLGVNMSLLQEKIILSGKENTISAVEILALKIIGIAALPLVGIPAILSKQLMFVMIAIVIFMALYLLPVEKIKDAIKEREKTIVYELPAFIEQLYMCMESGANLKPGLEIVSKKTGGVLGEAFQSALILASYSGSWEKELQEMGEKMKVEPLQDFINDVLIAFDKGISITETLRNEVKHINSIKKSRVREEVQALQSKLILPIIIFFLLPTLAIVMIPVMIEAMIILK